MGVTRRGFIMIGLGLFATGCASKGRQTISDLPSPTWPGDPVRPRPSMGGTFSLAPTPPVAAVPPRVFSPSPPPSVRAPDLTSPAIPVIPRSQWAGAAPIMSRINPMNGVNRITVHHEGWTPVWFTDTATTADRLERDRKAHIVRLGAGDLGYHYVIDRTGKVWQGRDARYQGAHVHGENEHNLGVMVLGNFEIQSPSDAQLGALREVLRKLRHHHSVPLARVYTHRELNPTACPGRALQPRMDTLRHNGMIA